MHAFPYTQTFSAPFVLYALIIQKNEILKMRKEIVKYKQYLSLGHRMTHLLWDPPTKHFASP